MDEGRRIQFLAEYAAGRRSLLDMDMARETAALRTVVDQMARTATGEVLWAALGISNPHLSWWAFELPTGRLLGAVAEASTPGDVDLIVGSLELTAPASVVEAIVRADPELVRHAHSGMIWQLLAERGLMQWPPRLSHLAAVEARIGRWFANDTQHGIQARRQDYAEKARGLVAMGFDDVVLLHLVATEAVGGQNFGAWLGAGVQAAKATSSVEFPEQAHDQPVEAPFGRADDKFSEVVWAMGSVPQRSEFFAGAGRARMLRQGAQSTPPGTRAQELRGKIGEFFLKRLGRLSRPNFAPVFVHQLRKNGNALIAHPSVFHPEIVRK